MPLVENAFLIRATPREVWAVLADSPRYAEWNPRLVRVDGAWANGAVVTLHYKQAQRWLPGRFVVRVDAFIPETELRFSGPMNAARALLRASHYFRMSPDPEGTRFVHGERFEGAIASAIWPVLGPAVAQNHADVNAAIRARCEFSRTPSSAS